MTCRRRTLIPALLLTLSLGLSTPAALAQSSNMTLLGQRAFDPVWHSDIWGYDSGGVEIAIHGARSGVSFMNVTDPTDIQEVFYLPGVDTIWRDIKTYQNYAYIVNDYSGDDLGEGIRVVDMSDPLNPVHVRDITSESRSTHNVWIDEELGLLFTTDVNTYVYDLTADPSTPAHIFTFDEYYVHDMYSRNGVGYMGAIFDGFLATVDLTTIPVSMPTLDTEITDDAFTHNVWLTNEGTHALTTDERSGGHITVVDVSDPTNISSVGSWVNTDAPTTIVHNVIVKGDLAYVGWYSDGINVLDVSDPLNVTRVAYYDTYPADDDSGFNGAWGSYCFAPSGNLYVSDINTGLYVFSVDVSPVAAPEAGITPSADLRASSPNPFLTQALVSFELAKTMEARLEVFDATGRFVARLADGMRGAGEHTVAWDGRTAGGLRTAPGVYHVRLATPAGVSAIKLVQAR